MTPERRAAGLQFQALRLKTEMNQATLAERLGVSHSAISAIELGFATIAPELYAACAEALNTTLEHIAMLASQHEVRH